MPPKFVLEPEVQSFVPSTRRAMMTGLGALSLAASFGDAGRAQNTKARTRIRIPVTATGQAAIGRVRGRFQIAYDELGLVWGAPIYLRLVKDQKRLEVWVKGRQEAFVRLRAYKICGANTSSSQRRRGGSPTQPEGFYTLTANSLRPQPITYLGIDLGWPNTYDRAQGWTGPTSLLQAGCAGEPHFGLTDQDMEEVYTLVHSALSHGQANVALHIFPFEMNTLRMMTASRTSNTAFWRSLQPAWQAFERTKKPPQVRVLGRRYVVTEN
jgi:murein L,D-transpeptidase YafK